MSSAAKKAWRTRQKKYGKSGMKKHKTLLRPVKEYTVYTVEEGKVIPHKEPFTPKKPTTLYYSTGEAQEVAKRGS